jgi:hypothetical protein
MIELGGKEREFRYGLGAIRRLEKHFGAEEGRGRVPATELFNRMQTGEIGLIVDLTWAGLLHADPDLEIGTVEKWLDDSVEVEAVAEEVARGLTAAFGNGKKKSKTKTKVS